MALLSTERVTMRFGGLIAVSSLDVRIEKDEIVGLIGPNGAGKTTVFNVITGDVQARPRGASSSRARRSPACRATEIARRGIARTFQNIRLFRSCRSSRTSWSAATCSMRRDLFEATLHLPALSPPGPRGAGRSRSSCCGRWGSTPRPTSSATSLPYGKQRRLEIARALATAPDAAPPRRAGRRHEPAGVDRADGPHPADPRPVRPDGPPHRAPHAGRDGRSASGSTCSTTARPSPQGDPAAIQNDPKVIEAYLGARLMLKVEPALRRTTAASTRSRASTLDGAGRRDRHPDRRQRRRQEHDAARHLGLVQALGRDPSPGTARRLTGLADQGHRRARACAWCPRARSVFPNLTVRREPDARRLLPLATRPASPPTSSKVFDLFPRLTERGRAEGRHALRRRAADAGGRPRPHDAARAC